MKTVKLLVDCAVMAYMIYQTNHTKDQEQAKMKSGTNSKSRAVPDKHNIQAAMGAA